MTSFMGAGGLPGPLWAAALCWSLRSAWSTMSRMVSSTSAISFIWAVLYLVKSIFFCSFSLYGNSFFLMLVMVSLSSLTFRRLLGMFATVVGLYDEKSI